MRLMLYISFTEMFSNGLRGLFGNVTMYILVFNISVTMHDLGVLVKLIYSSVNITNNPSLSTFVISCLP